MYNKKTEQSTDWLLLYDKECKFCTKFAKLIEKFASTKVSNLSLQEHYERYGTISLDKLLSDIHLIGTNGEILCGTNAVSKVISLIPEMKPFRWLIESRFGKKGTSVIYGKLKRIRQCSRCHKNRR